MFRLGAVNTIGEAEINLDFVNTQNSIVKYCYKFIDIHQPTITRNKLVSGLDATKPISCLFDFNNSTESIMNTFVISLFRLPHLCTDFIKQRAMTVIKVYTHNKIEYWYVLGVRKLYESVTGAKIKKIRVNNEEYDKELCRISGNIPKDLLSALHKYKVSCEYYLQGLCVNFPPVEINRSEVLVMRDG